MIIKISNHFNISVDNLLKQDHQIVSKIDFQKRNQEFICYVDHGFSYKYFNCYGHIFLL